MKIAKKKSGLIIGIIFTAVSILLTVTFVVPIISVLPGMLFETISKNLVANEHYSNVGKTTILLLTILLLLTLLLSLLWIKNKTIKQGYISIAAIIAIMFIFYCIVHSLGFYIYWGVALNFKNDGQLLFGAIISYPISSFAFIFIGLIIDYVKNKYLPKSINLNL